MGKSPSMQTDIQVLQTQDLNLKENMCVNLNRAVHAGSPEKISELETFRREEYKQLCLPKGVLLSLCLCLVMHQKCILVCLLWKTPPE